MNASHLSVDMAGLPVTTAAISLSVVVRARECPCEYGPCWTPTARPCTPAADHLARFGRANRKGFVTDRELHDITLQAIAEDKIRRAFGQQWRIGYGPGSLWYARQTRDGYTVHADSLSELGMRLAQQHAPARRTGEARHA